MTMIALVLDPLFGDRIAGVASETPLWVLASSANTAAVGRARQMRPARHITELLPRPGESSSDLLARAVFAIDEHHGSSSTSSPYEAISVYGADMADLSDELAADCGFSSTTQTDYGFVLRK